MTTKHPFDKCLCCGQTHKGFNRAAPLTQPELLANWVLLEQLGYTREQLLAEHVEQLDWQLPGMATWLRGQ